jgi:hypothetical protein
MAEQTPPVNNPFDGFFVKGDAKSVAEKLKDYYGGAANVIDANEEKVPEMLSHFSDQLRYIPGTPQNFHFVVLVPGVNFPPMAGAMAILNPRQGVRAYTLDYAEPEFAGKVHIIPGSESDLGVINPGNMKNLGLEAIL